MPKNTDRRENDFSKYDAMTSEELAELLRLDSEAPEGKALDIDTLLYITGVLAERKKSGKTAQQAWEDFQQEYLPAAEDCCENEEDTVTNACKPWVRRLIAAAAVVVILVCVPLTAKAFGLDKLWDKVAKWTKETFSFVREDQPDAGEPSPRNTRQYESLEQTLEQMGEDPDLIPAWLPEGYELEEIDIQETPMQRNYVALYIKGEQNLNIAVRSSDGYDPVSVEVSEDLVEIYNAAGVDYYIFQNEDRILAAWAVDSYECMISGYISLEEMKNMINSIPKG